MKVIASNYNGDCSWIPEFTDDYFIFDRTECGLDPDKVRKVKNYGNCDFDKLTYIIENYDNLPEVFMLIKSNLFKYITREEFDKVKDNKTFTPLLTQNHRVHEPVSRYVDGMYEEINNSWYSSQFLTHYKTYGEWAKYIGLPTPDYLQFAPGGNYILTPKEIHKHPKELYEKMRGTLGRIQLPGEAQYCERSYYQLWS